MKLIALFIILFFNFAMAQDEGLKTKASLTGLEQSTKTKAEKKSPDSAKSAEKITVTGSHIKRIDVEGPTPLVTLDREAFNNTGVNTVEEAFQESPYFQSVLDGGSNEGHARFHGQHAGNTLYLLNGMRLPKEAGGFYTSISYIPTSAIERIEILKDGGSAVYGSDAMAGVVNFLTRQDIDGTNFTLKFKTNEDGVGTEQNYVTSYGTSSSDSSFLIVGQYRNLDSFSELDIGSFNKKGDESELKFKQVQPLTQDVGLLTTGHYDLANGLEISATGIFNNKKQVKSQGPLERDVPELGAYITDRVSNTYSIQGQLKKYLSDTWDVKWQNSYSFQNVENKTVSGDATRSALAVYKSKRTLRPEALETKNSLAQSLVFPVRKNQGQLYNSKLIATGDLMDLGAGSLSMAIGAEFEYESFKFNNDSNVTGGDIISFRADNFKGQRRVHSAFTELSLTPWDELEIQAAGRFDNYNDFGSTVNPKLALSYRPHRKVMFRTSYGTGFKPPGVKDPFQPAYNRNDSFYDPNCPRGQADCKSQRQDVTVVNNPGATFETSSHYNFGLIIQPIKQLTLTIDQWNFEGEGTISNFKADHLMDFVNEFGNADKLKNLGAKFSRDGDGNIVDIQVPNIFNRAEKTLRGVDFSAEYDDQAFVFGDNLSYGISTAVSHIYLQKERRFEFSEEEEFENSGTQNTAAIYGSIKNHYARLAARTLLNGSYDSVRNEWDHPVYTEYDITYSLSTRSYGEFTLGVKNLLGKKPPVDTRGDRNGDVAFGSTGGTFEPLGRRWFLSYSKDL